MKKSRTTITTTKHLTLLSGALALFVSAQASAALIDFENAGSLGLSDNDAIGSAYQSGYGVTFDNGYLEATGEADDDPQGFKNDVSGKYDDPASGYSSDLGDFFLRSGGTIDDRGGAGLKLTINYDTPVTAASGDIWDIDGNRSQGTEQWQTTAVAISGSDVVDSSPVGTTNQGNSLNGVPYRFNLANSDGFNSIEFTFTGTKDGGTGLAFDNFNTNSLAVPEPTTVWMFGLGIGLLGLGLAGRRRSQRPARVAV